MSIVSIITKYCENKDDIKEETKATYIKQAERFGVKQTDKMSYNYMLKKLNEQFGASPSSQLQGVHILLISTKETKPRIFEKLLKLNKQLKEDKDDGVKEKNVEKLNTLPSYGYLIEKLDELDKEGFALAYFINYILINYGFRNQDFNLINIKSKKEFNTFKKGETLPKNNYIYHNKQTKQIELLIQVYKTAKTYGAKHIKIRDETFIEHFNALKLSSNQPLFRKVNGQQVSPSYLGDIIYNYSIDNLREANIFKIVVKHLIDTKNFSKLDEYVKTRGTSMAEIMKSYNIHRVKPEESESESESDTESMKELKEEEQIQGYDDII